MLWLFACEIWKYIQLFYNSISTQDMAALEKQCGSSEGEVQEDAKPKARAKPKAKGKAKAKQQAKGKAKAKAKTKAKAKAGGPRKRTRPAAASKQADENEGGEEEPVEEDVEMDQEEEEEEEEEEEAEEVLVMKRPSMKAPDNQVTRERKPALPQPEMDSYLLPKKAAPAVEPAQPEFAIPPVPPKRIRKAETLEESQISGWFLGLSGLVCCVELYVSLVVLFHASFPICVYLICSQVVWYAAYGLGCG